MPDKKSIKQEDALSIINRDLAEKVCQERAKDLNLPYMDVGRFPINPDILHVISPEEARAGLAMLFYKTGKKLRIAVADPDNAVTVGLLKRLEEHGFEIQIHLASEESILEALGHYASEQYRMKTETKNVVKEEEIQFEKELANLARLKDEIAALPAEEALNLLHVSAIKAGASDIHYQPEENACTLRFRIDGVLHTVFEIGKDVYGRIAGQLKYKAKMKLNISNIPQDGRFRFIVNERKIDVRVAVLPTEYGESFVCRILDSGKHFATFAELGFRGHSLELLKKAAETAQGMILATGPTSSGKTTTLYVLLQEFNKPELKVITLEDPIEYHLQGITQSQIDEKHDYRFASGLRSVLRQDPDVVMIGEIRDLETAEVCAQAALTGHVLLSTLHTNSAIETIPRLLTLGLPSFMVAPALSIVIAQRLTRRLCPCMEARPLNGEEKIYFEKVFDEIRGIDPALAANVPGELKKARGCEACNLTGYRGQMVISEVLEVDDEIKDAILKNKSVTEIFSMARKKGFLLMKEDAFIKVAEGVTTIEEVHRVISA